MGRTAQKRKRKQRRANTGAGPGKGSPNQGQVRQVAAQAPARSKPASASKAVDDGMPAAPWGTFPLSEIVTLIALVMLILGFLIGPPRGNLMIGVALVLGSLAGLELAVREHLAGYRSHTLLLGGFAGVVALAAGFYFAQDAAPLLKIAASGVAFALAAWGSALVFRRRSGGDLMKLKG